MIETPTAFILGAGASEPYGYPTGAQLKKYIVNNFPSQFASYCTRYNEVLYDNLWKTQALEFVEDLRHATGTIDQYLSRRPEFAEIGKAAILLAMFYYEELSHTANTIKEEDDWFSYLYNEMTHLHTNPGQVEFGTNPIAFISFNYDRVLEQKLFDASIHNYGAQYEPEIIAQIKNIPVEHVYGKIADLPHESPDQNGDFIHRYGTAPTQVELLGSNYQVIDEPAARRIKIVNEEREEITNVKKIHEIIRRYTRLIFLGFRYHRENMEILGFPETLGKDHRLYGTCIDMREREVRKDIYEIITDPPVPRPYLNFKDSSSRSLEYLRRNL